MGGKSRPAFENVFGKKMEKSGVRAPSPPFFSRKKRYT